MKLDFRALQQPSMECVLLDDANTVIHVMPPTLGDLKRLEAMRAEAQALKGKKADQSTIHKTYDLLAEIMSHNEEGLRITGKELNVKYRLKLLHLLAFEKAYMGFIDEIKAAKN